MTEKLRDPYDEMTDDQFDRYVADLMARPRTRSISLKMPEDLIARTRAVAERKGVPYQTLMKALIEAGLQKLERAS